MGEVFTPKCPAKERLAYDVQAALRRALRELCYLDAEEIVNAALRHALAVHHMNLDSAWVAQERALKSDPDPE